MRTVPKSRLLLLELVIDFIIFALCAVVCAALLFQARTMSDESTRLTQAVYIAPGRPPSASGPGRPSMEAILPTAGRTPPTWTPF